MNVFRLIHKALLNVLFFPLLFKASELIKKNSDESPFAFPYQEASFSFSHLANRPSKEIRFFRYDDNSNEMLCNVSDKYLSIFSQFIKITNVNESIDFLLKEEPEVFWSLYNDIKYCGELTKNRLYAFVYVMRSKYIQGEMLKDQWFNQLQVEQVELNRDSTFLISGPYSNLNTLLTFTEYFDFLSLTSKTLSSSMVELYPISLPALVDLHGKNITTIDRNDNRYDSVKKIILSENLIQNPSLRNLRCTFPNIKSIDFSRCPLSIPEQEAERAAWFNDLYELHWNSRFQDLYLYFPFCKPIKIGYKSLYSPLTIYLSPDCSQEVCQAFYFVADCKPYNAGRIILKTIKIFFYTICAIAIFAAYAFIKKLEDDKKVLNMKKITRRDEESVGELLDWCLRGIKNEYQSQWIYPQKPTIIIKDDKERTDRENDVVIVEDNIII